MDRRDLPHAPRQRGVGPIHRLAGLDQLISLAESYVRFPWVIEGLTFAGCAAQGVAEQDAGGHGPLRVQHRAIVRRRSGGREELLQVAAPAGHQPARHRLCRNNHRLLAHIIIRL